MTRKDYELIAAVMRESRKTYRPTVRRTVRLLADALESDNPRFDRERFIKACEE